MRFLLTLTAVFTFINSQSQIYTAKTGSTTITFHSDAPLENIDATNKGAIIVFKSSTAELQVRVTMQNFQFNNSLMKEHFNENYMESEKYPISEFKGTVIDSSNSNLAANGTYKVWLSGKLKIHGVEKDYKVPATLVTANGKIDGRATF
ncbi:MAG: YceI family protein, partial [Sphingobacteriia bacterium]|nr:YceI family protein [Sphingobacteriia bacterium]